MPKQVSVRPTDWEASRKASATRLTTWRVRESSTLPPLILLPGQRPNQEQKALALRHLLISTPISETISSTGAKAAHRRLAGAHSVRRHSDIVLLGSAINQSPLRPVSRFAALAPARCKALLYCFAPLGF